VGRPAPVWWGPSQDQLALSRAPVGTRLQGNGEARTALASRSTSEGRSWPRKPSPDRRIGRSSITPRNFPEANYGWRAVLVVLIGAPT
jgi:hypothetical protein